MAIAEAAAGPHSKAIRVGVEWRTMAMKTGPEVC